MANAVLRRIHRLFICIVGAAWAFTAATATAQISDETARRLMRESGLWSQLADMRTQVKSGLDSGFSGQPLPPAAKKSAHALADKVFSPQVLRMQMATSLRRYVSPQVAASALQWYASPTGQLITGLEVASSSSPKETQRFIEEGNQALTGAGIRRKQQLMRLLEVTRSAELIVETQIQVAVGMVAGMRSGQPHAPGATAATLERELRRHKPQMVAASAGVAMALYAAIYATVSDAEIDQYLDFLGSNDGMRFHDAVFQSFVEITTRQATQYGRELADIVQPHAPTHGPSDNKKPGV